MENIRLTHWSNVPGRMKAVRTLFGDEITPVEFKAFWESLSEEEKDAYGEQAGATRKRTDG